MDFVTNSRKNPAFKQDWKFRTMVMMSVLMAIKLMTILMYAGRWLGVNVVWVKIEALPGTMLDSFASFFVQFGLPCLFLNYFLLFYKDRYKILLKKHPGRNGSLFATYMFITLGIFVIPVIFMWLLQ